ncbi:hypothetical protein CK203_103486 [Vitis vinifera]|uniref:Uncharacterized protein n=1 Tax=Vitis vinifera TaxID=29760 RepID=A0A438DJZ3_VITVI|nr:hypothetical protein CK203_103486 [Vitis vinifera]
MAPKKTVSSVRVSEASEKAIDKLNAKEFRERFRIPHDVLIDLVNEEAAMPTEKGGKNVSSSQRNNSTRGSGSLCRRCSRNSSTSLRFHPSSFIPTLSGTARFDKGRGEGAGGSLGWMGGAIAASVEAFFSELYLKNSGFGIEGPPCGLGGKGVLCLCLQIIRNRSQGEGLQNIAFRAEFDRGRPGAQEYVINILPRKLAKDEIVPGEHYTVKELPLYQEAKEADAERRRKLLEDRDQKKLKALSGRLPDRSGVRTPSKENFRKKGKLVKKHGKDAKEPTPPKEFPPPQTTYEGEVMIEEPVNAAPHSISSGPGRMSGGGRKPKSAFRRPGSLGHSPGERASLKKPRLTRDLQSGLFERLQERQQEIEISCASAHDAHPDGGEIWGSDSGTRVPLSSSSEEESADDAAPASPFSYAELEVKLKQITPDWKAIKPSAKMFDMIETLVRGLRSMSQQHDLFTQLLQTADYMRTFSSRRQEIENQLRLRMEEAEASLSTMREENEALRWSWLRQRVEKNQLRAAFMRRRVRQPG